MKRLLAILSVLAVLVMVGSPLFASGASETAGAKKDITIGVVIPYEIGWFAAYHKGYQQIAEKNNVKIVWAYHNYEAAKETTAVQNLISQGVDAINLTAVTPESAEYSAELANEAKIPIQVTESGVAEGKGKPMANVDFDWANVYTIVADGIRKGLTGDLSVVWLQGFAGTPPVMQGDAGFKAEIAKLQGIKLATAPQDGKYATKPSLDITKTLVESGLKFNVAIGGCQEITDGIIRGLQEENVPRGSVAIVTVNGGPMDVDNLQKGNIDYALSQSPGLHGMINAANLIAYMRGQTYQKQSYSPVVWVTKDDWQQKLIPWDVDASWVPVVDEFVKTGKYKPELRTKA